ncbi:hypothetical protein [Sphingomonas oryzagri]
MADTYVQGSFAFTCTAAESALIEEAWQHASDLMDHIAPGEPSAEFLTAFAPTELADPFTGLTAIFFDPDYPDFGAEIAISGAELCTVAIYGITDFQPDPIAEVIRRCCRQTLQDAPIGFDWSYSSNRPARDSFGGGWCAIVPDRIDTGTTREDLSRALKMARAPAPASSDHWKDDPGHPAGDWRNEVANDETRLGYLEWIAARVDSEGDHAGSTTAQ